MTQNKDALLPCPFCGGEGMLQGYTHDGVIVYQPQCTECAVTVGEWNDDKDFLMKVWNTRAFTPPVVDVEALKRPTGGMQPASTRWIENVRGWNDCIDHLHAQGCLNATNNGLLTEDFTVGVATFRKGTKISAAQDKVNKIYAEYMDVMNAKREGFVSVPIEPSDGITDAILATGLVSDYANGTYWQRAYELYETMIKAAQEGGRDAE